MVCADVSDILYLGGTLSENSCIVCTHLSVRTHVTSFDANDVCVDDI